MKTTLAAAAALLALALAGCGGHRPRDGAAAQMLKDQDDAADAIDARATKYLDAREKGVTLPSPAASASAIGASDYALEELALAADASRAARHSESIAEDDPDLDPGRAARAKSTAGLVRRASQVVENEARAVLGGRDDAQLKADATTLRALLRALKVDVAGLERAADE
jgi:hypothetical protein